MQQTTGDLTIRERTLSADEFRRLALEMTCLLGEAALCPAIAPGSVVAPLGLPTVSHEREHRSRGWAFPP